ncbi:MAG: hypothetical protein KAI41_07535 [Hyphomicrobiaceae bacterium]|nr:hypothetical protein [Hyphomicrobiaceae bacterium]
MRLHSLIALGLLLAASPAFACTGQSVYLNADFSTHDLGWGEEDARFQVSGGEAVLKPAPGTQTARWNRGVNLTNLDSCVTISMPEATAEASRSYAGLLFWLEDKNNFYEAVISPNGLFTVARKIRGKLVEAAPVPWTKAGALKLAPGEKNTLRVTLEGQMVVVRINDSEVARFRGQPPDGPSNIGLVAASSPDVSNTWHLSELKVTNVPLDKTAGKSTGGKKNSTDTAASAPGCADGKVLFVDNFRAHDPTWGRKDARLKISSGKAVFTPVPGTRTFRWNRVFVFDDLDACATVSLAKGTSDATASYAGLMFWVEDNQNYYQAVIAPNGYFTIARIINGRDAPSRPIKWTKTNAIKYGAKKKNTLRLILKGDQVGVLINGKEVANFTGEPPSRPSYIGLLAASAPSKRGDTWSVTDFKITEPQ